MITIGDVARRAGVSTMTVSRAINHAGYPSQATHERVERATAECGNVRNALATSLHQSQTRTLVALLTDVTNPIFTAISPIIRRSSCPLPGALSTA
jgi:DNA-binding LacI/PurR family transcriptional regulator